MVGRLQAQLAIAFTLALGSTFAIPPNVFSHAADVLAALLGLVLAGVLPSMAVTATALRSGGLRVEQIRRYAKGLRNQMGFWVGLFLLGLFAGAGLATGEGLQWSIVTPRAPWVPQWIPTNGARLVVGWVIFFLALIIIRLPAFYRALISLVDLAEDSAVSEADLRDKPVLDRIAKQVGEIETPPEFGKNVALRRRTRQK